MFICHRLCSSQTKERQPAVLLNNNFAVEMGKFKGGGDQHIPDQHGQDHGIQDQHSQDHGIQVHGIQDQHRDEQHRLAQVGCG